MSTHRYWNKSSITPQQRILNNDYDACVAAGGPGDDRPCKRLFGSMHPRGLNFAMCDGSVRFFSYDTDIELLGKLATIDGGEKVPELRLDP